MYGWIRYAALVVLLVASSAWPADPPWDGQPVSKYVEYLRTLGHRIIYSSDLVRDDVVIRGEPEIGDPVDALKTILAPHGLTLIDGPADSLLITKAASEAGSTAPVGAKQEPVIEEIVVTSSLHRLQYMQPGERTHLQRELATRIPTTGDEVVRIVQRLPGTANGGISTRTHVRGGAANEVLFLLDGLRLYEPYHLKDFQSVSTIVNSNAIDAIDFYSGGYSVRYGDRMSGVMDLSLRAPEAARETEISLSFFNTSVLSLGRFGDAGQGSWLAAARRGNLDLILDVVDPDRGNPDFNDLLLHADYDFGERAQFSVNALVSRDKIALNDQDNGESGRARYDNNVAWLKWNADWTAALSSETILSFSDITDVRSGQLDLPGIVRGNVSDQREFRAVEVRQDWQFAPSPKWMLRFGAGLRDQDAEYRYASTKEVSAPFDTILDNEAFVERNVSASPGGAQYAAYLEWRFRPLPGMFVDLGIRWDQQNYTTAEDDKQYSPRLAWMYQVTDKTEVRFSWGTFFQAQEINELQVSDGVDRFFPAQEAEQIVVGISHAMSDEIEFKWSAYQKKYRRLQPRFENLFNRLVLVPELHIDRVLIDPLRGRSRGVEFLVSKGNADDSLLWWAGYSWSIAEDRMSGGHVRRSWDQSHSGRAGLAWNSGKWSISAAAAVHTGWPRTDLVDANQNGVAGIVPQVSARNAANYATFHSLDLRISRSIDVSRGDLDVFLDVTNLYNRSNPCCTEYSLGTNAGGDSVLAATEAYWLPLVPSLGILWRF